MSIRVIAICLINQVRVVNGVPPTGDYSFAKYNKVNALRCFVFEFGFGQYFSSWLNISLHALVQAVDVIKYTDEEYDKYLTNPVGNMSKCIVLCKFMNGLLKL